MKDKVINAKPLFSILIANYNNSKYLTQCMESIVAQTYDNIEVIIVDDRSTDDSIVVIESLKSKYPIIQLHQNDINRGAGFTKKRCIDLSAGELCGFLDPDDALTPEAVALMVEKHSQYENASLVYSTNYECDQYLNVKLVNSWIKQQPSNEPVYKNTYVGHFATFKKALYAKTAGPDSALKRAVDHDLYCLLEEVGELIFVDKPLYYYRQHDGGISLKSNRYKAEYWDWIVKHKYAIKNGADLEEEYSRIMSSRIPVEGRLGKVLLFIYRISNKLLGRI